MKVYLFDKSPDFIANDSEGKPIGVTEDGAEEPLDLSGMVTSVDFGKPDPGADG